MAYTPLQLPEHLTPAAYPRLHKVITEEIEQYLRDLRTILAMRDPEQFRQSGALHVAATTLALATIDGCAQLLLPGPMGSGDRFKRFLLDYAPLDIDPPRGMDMHQALDWLWTHARCPIIHRLGLAASGATREVIGVARMGYVANVEQIIECLEELLEDHGPFGSTLRLEGVGSTKCPEGNVVIQVEGLYWWIRVAVRRAINDAARCAEVETWIVSGLWDPVHQRRNAGVD